MANMNLFNRAVYSLFGLFCFAAGCDTKNLDIEQLIQVYTNADSVCTVTRERSSRSISEIEKCIDYDGMATTVSRIIEMHKNGSFRSSLYKEWNPGRYMCGFEFYEADEDNDGKTELTRTTTTNCAGGRVVEISNSRTDQLGRSTSKMIYRPDHTTVVILDYNGDGVVDNTY